MAEHKFVSMLEEMVTCSICVEVIADPRQLQCLHTYCYNCLVQYLKTKDKKDEIECPECRKWCPLPNGKVEGLPVSFLHNQLKDVKPSNLTEVDDIKSKKVRPTCSASSCSGKTAAVFCDVCRYICDDCQKDHSKVVLLKDHVIKSIEEALKDKENELPSCPKHPRELMKLYCEDCQIPICLLCYPLNHAQHKCTEIMEKSTEAKNKLANIMKTINSYLQIYVEMAQIIEEHTLKISATAEQTKRTIITTVDTRHEELDELKAVITQGVEKNYKQAEKMMQGQADRISILHATLNSIKLCGVQLVLYGKPCDFLLTVPSIQKQLDNHNPDDITLNLQDLDVTDTKRKLDNVKVT